MIQRALAFAAAVVCTYFLAAIAATQAVLGQLQTMGVEIPLADRFSAIGHDLLSMAPTFVPMVLVALLLGFGVCWLIVRRATSLRILGYVLAGFVAMVSVHMLLKLSFDITPVAATRETFGLLMQGLAGAAGGYLFVRLTPSGAVEAA